LSEVNQFDVAVIGGGATGVGIALEAAASGFKTVLIESHDIGKGTSSRATKLVHGGVRYLAQGDFLLVREALNERKIFFKNASHLAQPLGFVMPAYKRRDLVLYGIGLHFYDAIAGSASVGRTHYLSKLSMQDAAPQLRAEGLFGGLRYWDGQFDDARMALAVARTAALHDALILNYCEVTSLFHTEGKISGLKIHDKETGSEHEVMATCVINAAGVWSNAIKKFDPSESIRNIKQSVRPSQGAHIVVDRSFWPSNEALLIPKTKDGRVLFAIPWLGSTLLGTTDTESLEVPIEPVATEIEVDFILGEIAQYLKKPPTRSDVKSVWAGLRPLANSPAGTTKGTSSISREHTIEISDAGLVSVTGGKWTTYRLMAEQVMHESIKAGLLDQRSANTKDIELIGAMKGPVMSISLAPGYHLYGSEQDEVKKLPGADRWVAPGLTEAMVRFAARYEYARTVEDVLARRSRILFLDAAAARQAAQSVGEILQEEIETDPKVNEFENLCSQYLLDSTEII
jgi:glycerol-3-phosphate dehydrogenase